MLQIWLTYLPTNNEEIIHYYDVAGSIIASSGNG